MHKNNRQFGHLLILRRELNQLETRLDSNTDIREATAYQADFLAEQIEVKRLEIAVAESERRIAEPKPINFYKIESVEAATSPTASV